MAAGQGYIEFATGDVLTAAAANGYLASQVVMVFASSAARTSAIASPQEGMLSYLKDTNAVEAYDGAAWISVGSTGDITGVTAGTGISGGGTSGTVTVTNSMATAIDAKGDLIAGTGADAFSRLAVGTNGQVLTADSTAATGLAWASTSGGSAGLTLIAANDFSGVSSVSRTSDFTSTYNYYRLIFNIVQGSTNASAWLRFSTVGTDDTTSAYYLYGSPFTASAQNKMDLLRVNSSANTTNFLSFDIINPKVATQTLINALGLYQDSSTQGITYLGGLFNGTTQFDGWTILATGGTFQGSYAVYGYNK